MRGASGRLTGLLIGAILVGGLAAARAAEEKTVPGTSVPGTSVPSTPAGGATSAAALPAYFSGVNRDPHRPSWPDANGSAAATSIAPAADGKGDVPSRLSVADLFDRVAHNAYAINVVWVLLAGFLVMFMQVGFAMVETGLCRAKNAAHTMSMNFMIYPLACTAFWVYGFALGFGNWANAPVPAGWVAPLGPGTAVLNRGAGLIPVVDAAGKATGAQRYGLMGLKGFFLNGAEDVSVLALFFYMMMFMDTAATIPTGALAERWKWKNFCLYGLWVALPYSLYANWVWGGGFLARGGLNWGLGHGAVDFAGSGVVHGMGGLIALAGSLVMGPRVGKYREGRPLPMPGHHIPMVVVGTLILALGWFGFNAGSTFSATDLRISAVVTNTMLASIAGPIAAMLTLQAKRMKPDPTVMCNGMLAGLVAITAPSAFVDSWAAFLIGGVAGVLVVLGVFFWEDHGVDDPVGAISVHGVCGLWGLIAVGIFASGRYGAGWNGVVRDGFVKRYGSDGVRGLLYGDASQLWMQLIDAAVLTLFALAMAYAWFKLCRRISPLRVSRDTELAGLDAPEMGALGYPDFSMSKFG
jgi:Amt family ammonium transporter